MLLKYTEWPKLLKYAEWPYRFILGILFGSRLMAHGQEGPARPLGPEGALGLPYILKPVYIKSCWPFRIFEKHWPFRIY